MISNWRVSLYSSRNSAQHGVNISIHELCPAPQVTPHLCRLRCFYIWQLSCIIFRMAEKAIFSLAGMKFCIAYGQALCPLAKTHDPGIRPLPPFCKSSASCSPCIAVLNNSSPPPLFQLLQQHVTTIKKSGENAWLWKCQYALFHHHRCKEWHLVHKMFPSWYQNWFFLKIASGKYTSHVLKK